MPGTGGASAGGLLYRGGASSLPSSSLVESSQVQEETYTIGLVQYNETAALDRLRRPL